MSLNQMVDATPDSRDRYMDFLRAASILVVVFGHWTIAIIWWERGLIYITNAVGVGRGLWIGTWIFQVMPIFFLVGGFSNLVAYDSFKRRGLSTWSFVRTRLERLLRPSLIFLGFWTVIQIILHLADIGRPTGPALFGISMLRGMRPPPGLPFGPLWFLGVYLIIVTISPWTITLYRRFGWRVPIALCVGAVVTDIVAFGTDTYAVRWFNVAFVLLFPHFLGHFYAEGKLNWSERKFGLMGLGGLVALVLLTNPWLFQLAGDVRFQWFPGIGYYPRSLLGTDVEKVSNAYPPTVVYLAVSFFTIGPVMALRPRLSAWLAKPRPWKAVIVGNSVIMTMFLWHMTAFLLAILVLWNLGFGRERRANAGWWAERPVWYLVSGAFLVMLIIIFGRFETKRRQVSSIPGES